jgi:hypothetical protein
MVTQDACRLQGRQIPKEPYIVQGLHRRLHYDHRIIAGSRQTHADLAVSISPFAIRLQEMLPIIQPGQNGGGAGYDCRRQCGGSCPGGKYQAAQGSSCPLNKMSSVHSFSGMIPKIQKSYPDG